MTQALLEKIILKETKDLSQELLRAAITAVDGNFIEKARIKLKIYEHFV